MRRQPRCRSRGLPGCVSVAPPRRGPATATGCCPCGSVGTVPPSCSPPADRRCSAASPARPAWWSWAGAAQPSTTRWTTCRCRGRARPGPSSQRDLSMGIYWNLRFCRATLATSARPVGAQHVQRGPDLDQGHVRITAPPPKQQWPRSGGTLRPCRRANGQVPVIDWFTRRDRPRLIIQAVPGIQRPGH